MHILKYVKMLTKLYNLQYISQNIPFIVLGRHLCLLELIIQSEWRILQRSHDTIWQTE